MIQWLKKINRSRNYFLKKNKLHFKLKMISLLSNRKKVRKAYKNKDIKHILLSFISKGIGDAVVIGGIVDVLTKYGYTVSIIADKRTYFLFKEWENIKGLYLYSKENSTQLIEKLKHCEPFIFVDSHEITHSNLDTFKLIYELKPHQTIGFTHKYSIYDSVISISNPTGHISTRYVDLLRHFNIEIDNYDYKVIIPEADKEQAKNFVKAKTQKKIISFIPYGSVSERFFSDDQIAAITTFLTKYKDSFHLFIIGEQHKIQSIPDTEFTTKNTLPSFFAAAQIIKDSSLVISPDTSFVHISRAFDKPLISIYPYKILIAPENNADVWGPNYDKARQIRLKERRLMDADVVTIIEQVESLITKIH
ncbi:MAG: glycosyl transferase [Proteobacteria bacterium]|nr:glycosyl transferase [Pseudomonadota bacterium]